MLFANFITVILILILILIPILILILILIPILILFNPAGGTEEVQSLPQECLDSRRAGADLPAPQR
jgi:hypothetical protein